MKRFSIQRTAALYRIEKLSALHLISEFKDGKKNIYLPVEGAALETFFKDKIAELESGLKEITSTKAHGHHKSRDQRLTLSFVNYYDLLPEYRKKIEKYYDIIDYSDTQLYLNSKEFIKRAKNADVVVNNAACEVTREMLDDLPRLQYMHTSTYMYQYIDLEACRRNNISISNIPVSYRSMALSEFLLAQTFALLRETSRAAAQVKSGVNEFRYFKGEQLRGKKAILFGTAPGTKEFIEQLRGMGVEIGVYAGKTKEDPAMYGLSRFTTQEEVFETGDIFYIPWTGDEEIPLAGNIDAQLLNKITRPVYIISIYKHKVVDFQKLRELVYSGLIKGIAFDYFPTISSDDSRKADIRKLMYLPNVAITPDIGWYTQDSVNNMNRDVYKRQGGLHVSDGGPACSSSRWNAVDVLEDSRDHL